MLLDISATPQSYVEDCEVCCNPLTVSFEVRAEEIVNFDCHPTQ